MLRKLPVSAAGLEFGALAGNPAMYESSPFGSPLHGSRYLQGCHYLSVLIKLQGCHKLSVLCLRQSLHGSRYRVTINCLSSPFGSPLYGSKYLLGCHNLSLHLSS